MELRRTLAYAAERVPAGRLRYVLAGALLAGAVAVAATMALTTPLSLQSTGHTLGPPPSGPSEAPDDDSQGWTRPQHEIQGQTPGHSPSAPSDRSEERGTTPDATGPDGTDMTADFVGWAVLDRHTGTIGGSDTMADTSTTASMIKVALVAEYLRRSAEADERPDDDRLHDFSLIVRDSHNGLAQELFEELGEHRAIQRVIDTCGLGDSSVVPHRWSDTQLSPRDTARLASCIADGTAVGDDGEWTDWLLNEMRLVRPPGDFGIQQALPANERGRVAIKNGWVTRPQHDQWHVNCLAVTDEWAMGVMVRYPLRLGYEHGAELCRTLAAQHLPAAAGAV